MGKYPSKAHCMNTECGESLGLTQAETEAERIVKAVCKKCGTTTEIFNQSML